MAGEGSHPATAAPRPRAARSSSPLPQPTSSRRVPGPAPVTSSRTARTGSAKAPHRAAHSAANGDQPSSAPDQGQRSGTRRRARRILPGPGDGGPAYGARVPEPVDAWWERRRASTGRPVPYAVGTYREEWHRYPVLVQQYHPELNRGVVLSQVPLAADVWLQWQCDAGHRFIATPGGAADAAGRPGDDAGPRGARAAPRAAHGRPVGTGAPKPRPDGRAPLHEDPGAAGGGGVRERLRAQGRVRRRAGAAAEAGPPAGVGRDAERAPAAGAVLRPPRGVARPAARATCGSRSSWTRSGGTAWSTPASGRRSTRARTG